MKVSHKENRVGTIPISLTLDEIHFIVFHLNLEEWRVSKTTHPVAHSVITKLNNAGKYGWKWLGQEQWQ